jgi:plastocyanin
VRTFLRGCAIAAAIMCAAACGGNGDKERAVPGPAPNAKRVDPATAAAIAGQVLFEGSVPATTPIDVSSDRACAEQNPHGVAPDQLVVDNGALDNVFVYVKDGLGDYYFDVPSDAVTLDQRGCRFVPHVAAVRVGQPLIISNSDDTAHNVHALPAANQGFNKGQALKNMADTKVFTKREVMIPFKCDIHPWMHAFVGVMDHPYFAVTGSGGGFELKDLPPGTYTIEAWHEKLGTESQQVTIAAKESKTVVLAFRPAKNK